MKHHWRYALVFPLSAWIIGAPVHVPPARTLPPIDADASCPGYAQARAQLFLAYAFRIDRPGWATGLVTRALALTRDCTGAPALRLRDALREELPAAGSGPRPPP